MKIAVDTHSHTIASGHAYSTMKEMILAGIERGLEGMAITEHAPKMPGTCSEIYFQNYAVIPRKRGHFSLMMGVELNIMDENGTVDLPQGILRTMDIVIASIHGLCYGEGKTREENTNAYLNAMKNPYIHIIGHPDDGRIPVDYEKLVRAAKETHTLLEVNNSSLRPGGFRVNTWANAKEMLEICKKEEVYITTGSDAHVEDDAGNFKYVKKILEEVDFPEKLISTTSYEKFQSLLKKQG
ncbi:MULTISPECIES: phosphatase [Sellimonas]|uniref:Phosphatase n=1 Tax=Sellimonas caecigallum TaxID=2592333 RepID=A0ABS7L3W6_9FIRM|nr:MULTISPECIES: phosphatase [Sellimonas]MBY0757735.1 phosphatase [Sellimonas caecigallum]OUP02917.1 phosphatase [Drancourtella sp. An210]OUP62336.1 phosphatase [Drancourtella sp. An177]